MKGLRVSLIELCAALLTGCATNDGHPLEDGDFIAGTSFNQLLVGRWLGKDEKGDTGAFIFQSDGAMEVIVGFNSFSSGKRGTITFRFDPTTTPSRLDIVAKKTHGDSVMFRGIVEFIAADSIRIRMNFGGSRPRDFSSDTMVMHRERKT